MDGISGKVHVITDGYGGVARATAHSLGRPGGTIAY